jgi:hypothetical protein
MLKHSTVFVLVSFLFLPVFTFVEILLTHMSASIREMGAKTSFRLPHAPQNKLKTGILTPRQVTWLGQGSSQAQPVNP